MGRDNEGFIRTKKEMSSPDILYLYLELELKGGNTKYLTLSRVVDIKYQITCHLIILLQIACYKFKPTRIRILSRRLSVCLS